MHPYKVLYAFLSARANITIIIVDVSTGVDSKSLQDKLQGWSADEIEALSVVYQTTDLNEDGLIDFLEL